MYYTSQSYIHEPIEIRFNDLMANKKLTIKKNQLRDFKQLINEFLKNIQHLLNIFCLPHS